MRDMTMDVRIATQDDALVILAWRNDETTRAMSRNTDIVAKETHLAWFAKAIENPNLLILIGLKAEIPAGMARFDKIDEDLWELNINIAPENRGRGIGKALLASALDNFYASHPGASVLAQVKTENTSSKRLFESLRFLSKDINAESLIQYLHKPDCA
jgi:ribosomal protein S18 acetylase RimI-like enzyme